MTTHLPASQSSVYITYPASYANDGNRHTDLSYNSCAHTERDTHPWWVVDLGLPLTVTGVLLTNRDGGVIVGAYGMLFDSNAKARAGKQSQLTCYINVVLIFFIYICFTCT